ncbi:MAG: methylase [Alphaproteobacteria bacterium]|nr:methylase [Alphaproteobacteria bacterium]
MGFRRKTRPGRLAQLDALVLQLAPDLLSGESGAPIVDLGVGARPWTTVELARAVAPVPVVGVDIAEDLVARAAEHAIPGLTFAVGSFDLPVRARLVRVMNVCRDLWPDEVPDAHARIGRHVVDGGVVIEGSCGPDGEVGTAHWMVAHDGVLERRGLLMWLDGTRGTAPLLFRDRLPRDLLGDLGHPVLALILAWMEAFRSEPEGPDRLERSARALGDASVAVVAPGAVMWTPPGGVPGRVGPDRPQRGRR